MKGVVEGGADHERKPKVKNVIVSVPKCRRRRSRKEKIVSRERERERERDGCDGWRMLDALLGFSVASFALDCLSKAGFWTGCALCPATTLYSSLAEMGEMGW